MVNIYPINDLREHTMDESCLCQPNLQVAPDGDIMVIHNSYDGRELREQQGRSWELTTDNPSVAREYFIHEITKN